MCHLLLASVGRRVVGWQKSMTLRGLNLRLRLISSYFRAFALFLDTQTAPQREERTLRLSDYLARSIANTADPLCPFHPSRTILLAIIISLLLLRLRVAYPLLSPTSHSLIKMSPVALDPHRTPSSRRSSRPFGSNTPGSAIDLTEIATPPSSHTPLHGSPSPPRREELASGELREEVWGGGGEDVHVEMGGGMGDLAVLLRTIDFSAQVGSDSEQGLLGLSVTMKPAPGVRWRL